MRGPHRSSWERSRPRLRSTSSRRSRSSARTQARLDLGGPVHEPRLVDISDRIRLAEGRNRHDGDAVELAQTRQRLAESCLPLAEVGAEADVGDHELTLETAIHRPAYSANEVTRARGRPHRGRSVALAGAARRRCSAANTSARGSASSRGRVATCARCFPPATGRSAATESMARSIRAAQRRCFATSPRRFASCRRADRRLAEAILARPTDSGKGNYTAPKGDFRHNVLRRTSASTGCAARATRLRSRTRTRRTTCRTGSTR